MNPTERRAAVALAGIFSFRMLGMFMILPVFALYAQHLPGTTPFMTGLAIGIYGLTQAVLQIPFGLVSDRIGRKPVITVGLIIFALGSVVAAMADTMGGVILGRALQGSGAVAAAVMALTADLTREEVRTRAMAMIGMSIGFSFLVSLVIGPQLNSWIGVPGIFWLTSLLALAGIGLLHLAVPNPEKTHYRRDVLTVPAQFGRVLRNGQLLRLDFGVLVLHMALTASFVVLPLALRDAGLAPENHSLLYLPVMVLSMALAVPFIIIGEKRRRLKEVVLGAIALLTLTEMVMPSAIHSVVGIAVLLCLFFTAFNLLEATMPSLITKTAPADSKGTATGIYSTSQFLGAFLGGAAGGALYGAFGAVAVFAFCALFGALWWWAMLGMQAPKYLSTRVVEVGRVEADAAAFLEAQLLAVPGVAEAVVNVEDGIAYLKVDNDALDTGALNRFALADRPLAEAAT